MTFEDKTHLLAEINPDALLADGYEAAFIGIVHRPSGNAVAAYDREACIDILMDRDDMTWEEAEDYFSYNTQEAYAGENTPVYIQFFEEDSE